MRAALLALAATLALAVAATVGYVVGRSGPTPHVVAVSAPAVSPAAVPVEPTRSISYYGLTLDVPASWPYHYSGCVAPDATGVFAMQPGGVSCAASAVPAGAPPPPAHPVLVLLQPWTIDEGPAAPIVVAGKPALRSVTADGDHVGSVDVTISFSAPRFSIRISGPSEATADAILDTARPVSTDPLGCAEQIPPDLRNPAAATIVPSHPVQAVVCDYDGSQAEPGQRPWLTGSRVLTVSALTDLVSRLEHAPRYTAPPPADPTGNPPYPKRYLFTLADGSTRTVDVRNDGNAASLDGSEPIVGSDGVHRVLLDTNGSWQPPGAFDPFGH